MSRGAARRAPRGSGNGSVAPVPRQQTGPADESGKRDVVFYVADQGMKAMIGAFLDRKDIHHKLGCGPFTFDGGRDIKLAPHKDSELPLRAGALLQPWRGEYRRAIVVQDHAYDNPLPPDEIRKRISTQLEDHWPQFAVVVIEPELENWFWSDHTPAIKKALVWRPPGKGDERTPRQVLQDAGLWDPGKDKPDDPKRAVEYLHEKKYTGPKNNGIFRRYAETVPSVRGCTDASFQHLRATLADWFPAETTTAYTTTEYAQ
ncbi:methylation-associated defense system protein MAD4 [Streptomyces collinus]